MFDIIAASGPCIREANQQPVMLVPDFVCESLKVQLAVSRLHACAMAGTKAAAVQQRVS